MQGRQGAAIDVESPVASDDGALTQDGIGLCLTAIASLPSVLDRFCRLQCTEPQHSLIPQVPCRFQYLTVSRKLVF